MKLNVGKADQTIRILLGVIIAIAGIYFKSWWGLVALVPLITAFTGLCPLYKILGISTNKTNGVSQQTNSQ
ncbi:hypothetical protein BH11BAC3_BH11BAC3_00950 [soil metagenome]